MNNEVLGKAKLEEISSPENEIPEYIRAVNIPISKSAEFSIEAEIDSDLYSRHIGFEPGLGDTFSITFKEPYQVQRRKHKKKRINKKWAKRYGYITKFRTYQVDEVRFTDNGCFQFEATSRNVRLIKEG
jgi:hypothetical protein